jgi:hypothetical protein
MKLLALYTGANTRQSLKPYTFKVRHIPRLNRFTTLRATHDDDIEENKLEQTKIAGLKLRVSWLTRNTVNLKLYAKLSRSLARKNGASLATSRCAGVR